MNGIARWILPMALMAASAMGAASDTGKVHMRNYFVPFGLCLSELKAADQIKVSQAAGYTGLGIERMDDGLISEFASHPDVVSGKFKVISALWWIGVDDKIDTTWLDGILGNAAKMGMAVWMVAAGDTKTDAMKSKAVKMFTLAARHCRAKGVKLVLYPHIGSVFETAEEALGIYDSLKRLGYSEVRLSIHLSHELKAGNRDRLDSIVPKVSKLLALASVNGADTNAYTSAVGGYWASAIKPLAQGTYDVKKYLRALASSGYAGPVELHTYGLKRPGYTDYDDHLRLSQVRWYELVDTTGTTRSEQRMSTGDVEPVQVLVDVQGRRLPAEARGSNSLTYRTGGQGAVIGKPLEAHPRPAEGEN